MTSETGSSPRVRGKPCEQLRGGWLVGLIPACAGKTKFHSACKH